MIAFLARLGPLRTDLTGQYRDLASLRKSVKSGDWGAVSEYFRQLPARSDQATAVLAVAETAGSERFLQRMVDTERDSSLARTLLGARLIVMAWDARGRALARYVSQAQFQLFFERLRQAERHLADATAIDPTNAAAWTERIITARGLSLGSDEARRRYDRAAEHCDAPFAAQEQMVQNLCPKWNGSRGAVLAFARECLRGAKPGSLSGAVIAHAHVELAFDGNLSYLAESAVRDELIGAAAHTVLHPDFRPSHGWVSAHTVFAFALFHSGAYGHAAPHFDALNRRATPYPWERSHVQWKRAFRRARSGGPNW